MKRLSLLSALLLLLGLPIVAQESISVGETLVPQGRPAMMEVMFNFNESHDYVSYQFTVNLPEGISFVTVTDEESGVDKIPIELGDGQSSAIFSNLDLNIGSHNVTCASNPSTPIGGSKGVLVRIPIQAEETIASGSELAGTLTGVVFATSDAVSHSFEDASFTIKVIDKVILDENYAWAPYATDDDVDIEVKRTINANEWSTICLPFDMDGDMAVDAFGDDARLATYSKCTSKKTSGKVTSLTFAFDEGDITDGIGANVPYLIRTTKKIEGFSITATIDPADEISDGNATKGKIIGTYKAGTIVPENSLFLSGNNFYYSAGKTKIKAYRAYFTFKDVLAEKDLASSRIFLEFENEGTTDLHEIQVLGENDGWYTISGQKLDKKPTTKGVYIHGGEKVIIKADRRK